MAHRAGLEGRIKVKAMPQEQVLESEPGAGSRQAALGGVAGVEAGGAADPSRFGLFGSRGSSRAQCAQPQLGAPHAAAFFAASFASRAREVLVVESPPSAVQRNSRGIWPATR